MGMPEWVIMPRGNFQTSGCTIGCYAEIVFTSGEQSDWKLVASRVQDWLNTQCKSAWGYSEGEPCRMYQPAFKEDDFDEDAEIWRHQWADDRWSLKIWIQDPNEMMRFKLSFA